MTQILSIAGIPAPFTYETGVLMEFMECYIDDKPALRKLKFIAKESDIETKHSVLRDFEGLENSRLYKGKLEWPSTAERLKVYETEAPILAEKASREAVKTAGIKLDEITDIITVSCTGMSAPGLEIALLNRLGLPTTTNRHAVNFMGCYAAFHGLRLADLICKSQPSAKVLLVCVELCSLHLSSEINDDNLLSTVLFGDGAAAVVLTGNNSNKAIAELIGFHSNLIPEGADDMAWRIGSHGFEMVLNRNISKHIEHNMKMAFQETLAKFGYGISDIQKFAIHPGGKNVLVAFANALGAEPDLLQESFEVLRDNGNMSSCTVLFVLERVLASMNSNEPIYSAAFGPGLTVESALIQSLKGS